jgi:ribosomal protein L37E
MHKHFTRNIEDFKCENCGLDNVGNGYTNHCSKCLFSKHVDVNPGDRLASCLGLMKPISFEKDGDIYFILHRCIKCGFSKRNKMSKSDNFDILLDLSKN